MTASELFDSLTGLPGARSVPIEGNGVIQSVLVAGVEFAHAANPDERALRAAWRRRARGGPTPLLLIADDPEELEKDGIVAIAPITFLRSG